MNYFFNKNVNIQNPLRILFLCGSHYKKKKKILNGDNKIEILDKRLILKDKIIGLAGTKNIRSIILEENFMFSNKGTLLNYNHINLKSLKSIEILTCMLSEKIVVLHESYSTAAEIGMFSSSDLINNKLIVFAPDIFTVDEEYISGFMKLAYQNEFYDAHNIDFIRYYPGTYKYYISNDHYKLHTYFVDNKTPIEMEDKFTELFRNYNSINLSLSSKKSDRNFYVINKRKVEVYLEPQDLVGYLLALFNINKVREEFRKNIDVSDLIFDTEANRKKRLFSKKKDVLLRYLKSILINTIKTEVPSINENVVLKINSLVKDITINECVSYFLYILYALGYISFKEDFTRFSLKEDFSNLYVEYISILNESKSKSIWGD